MHRWSILIIFQRDATQGSLFIIPQVHSTCFGCQPHPSSGVHKIVTAASGTCHIFVQLPPSSVAKTTPIIRSTQNCNYSLRYWSYFLRNYLPPTWPSLATLEGGSCTVPEAVVTVLCTLDDGCGWHPKHVEWTCSIITRLPCVASHRTVININLHFWDKQFSISKQFRHIGGWGGWTVVLIPLYFDTEWRWEVVFTTKLPYSQKTIPVPIEEEAGRAPESVRTFWRREHLLPLSGFEPLTIQPLM